MSGIEQMKCCEEVWENHVATRDHQKQYDNFFFILNIKISFVINTYRICLYHVGCVIFCMWCKNNLKHMSEKTLYHVRMT